MIGESTGCSISYVPSDERFAILSHLRNASTHGQRGVCPMTGRPLDGNTVVSKKAFQWKIRYWEKRNNGSFENAQGSIRRGDKIPDLPKAQSHSEIVAPSHFYCPLSRAIMNDPVGIGDDNDVNYERRVILKWLDCSGADTCPVTGNRLTKKDLVRNSKLSREIDDWTRQHDITEWQLPTQQRPVGGACKE
jgi:hypothetical protein